MENNGLWFGLYILVGLIFGGLAAGTALRKGMPPVRWFFLGMIFTAPVWAYLSICNCHGPASGRATTLPPLACPKCGALNHPAARGCPACGAALTPTAVSEVRAGECR